MKTEWVRVTERLPEMGGRYLGVVIWHKRATPEVVIVEAAYYPEQGGEAVWSVEEHILSDGNYDYPRITHWAPLPALPEEDGP